MSRAKFEAARELIQQKNYAAARAILEAMPDEPRAIEWLAKLDQIAPREETPRRGLSLPLFIVLTIIAISAAAAVVFVMNRSNSSPSPVAVDLPEMYIKHGMTIRYPAGWKVTDGERFGLTISPTGDSQAPELILVYVNRNLKEGDPLISVEKDCKNEKLKTGGIIQNDGKVILKPDGQFLPVNQVTVSGLNAVECGYKSENTVMKALRLRLALSDSLTLVGYSPNASTFEPMFDQMVNSFKIDPSQLGDWGYISTATPGAK